MGGVDLTIEGNSTCCRSQETKIRKTETLACKEAEKKFMFYKATKEVSLDALWNLN